MLWHFPVHKFIPLCRPMGKNDHLMTTNVLEDVNCEPCLEIVDNIATQAGVIRPQQGESQ